MKLSKSRIRYQHELVKVLDQDRLNKKGIGISEAMPFGKMVLFHINPSTEYIVIYEKEEYMKGRKIYMPKWLILPEFLDKRYKIREVTVNIEHEN
jgi:hypothetical protein